MSTYIMLINYTQQGIENVKDSPSRLDKARDLLQTLGGKVKDFYLTMGSHDIVATIEAPEGFGHSALPAPSALDAMKIKNAGT